MVSHHSVKAMTKHAKDLAAAFLERHGLTTTLTLHFDGACEPANPGGIATGGWIVREGDQVVLSGYREFKRGDGATNNLAEWCALGCGLRAILDNHEIASGAVLRIYGDSMLVVNQLTHKWNCNKEHLQKLRQRCEAILQELCLASWTAEWIPREQNDEADALSRRAYEEATGKTFPERVRQ